MLVIAAGSPDPTIPVALESRRLVELLPSATTPYVEIAGAAHFSFLPLCKPGSAALLAKSPDDAVVCRDGDPTATCLEAGAHGCAQDKPPQYHLWLLTRDLPKTMNQFAATRRGRVRHSGRGPWATVVLDPKWSEMPKASSAA